MNPSSQIRTSEYTTQKRMSEKRTILSRPRTRVYDCNYNIGEKYYKPALDQLDRKYSTPTSFTPSTFTPPIYTSRPILKDLKEEDDFPSLRRPSPFDMETSHERARRLSTETRSLEEDLLEDEIANSMRKLKVLRAAKASSVDEDLSSHNGILNGIPKQKRLNLTDKLLDSVGVNGKLQDSLEEEILKKRTVKMPTLFDEEPAAGLTKWTAFRDSFADEAAESAKIRARQSRARLADIESEIEAVAQKGLAREKRISNIKSLIAGEDPFLDNAVESSFKSKKTIKKVTF